MVAGEAAVVGRRRLKRCWLLSGLALSVGVGWSVGEGVDEVMLGAMGGG